MSPHDLHPWIAAAVTIGVFAVLQLRRGAPADVLFLGGLMAVTLTGVIRPSQALEGFANPAVLTIAGLLVVASGLRVTGVLDWVGRRLLGRVQDVRGALWRLFPTLLAASAFLLNTALVAMMMPVVLDWCRRRHISPSRVLLPLSYLTILGGVCASIGTSTTLVVQGKLLDLRADYSVGAEAALPDRAEFARQLRPMSLFEIGRAGLPCAVAGGLLLLAVGQRLLPDRTDMLEQLGEQRREYLVEMLVRSECPLIGETVEHAGLRHLPGLFLIEIDRNGEVLTPVTPSDVIHERDRLIFTGVVSTIVDLEKIPGLVPAIDRTYEFHPQARRLRHLTEVVLSRTSPLIGRTVREANFRQRYNAAVVAVHRNGLRLTNKIGDIPLEPGDTLLLQTRTEFVPTYRNSRDFYLVSGVEGVEPRLHHKGGLAAVLAVVLILWLVATSLLAVDARAPTDAMASDVAAQWTSRLWLGVASPAIAALTMASLMIISRCLSVADARNSIDLQTLVTIAAALGLGKALTESGAAQSLASAIVSLVGQQPYLLLIVMYLLAMVLTESITNNAVAAMLLPLGVAVAWQGEVNPRPVVIAITLAASMSFVTPIGYQTNLMVMGPGGYRASDYLRCGLPLAAVVAVVALLLIPFLWPLQLPSGAVSQ